MKVKDIKGELAEQGKQKGKITPKAIEGGGGDGGRRRKRKGSRTRNELSMSENPYELGR